MINLKILFDQLNFILIAFLSYLKILRNKSSQIIDISNKRIFTLEQNQAFPIFYNRI